MRLQKVLAGLGLAGRREIESWISAGRISVNGQLALLGQQISEKDKVIVDGERVDIRPYFKKRQSTVFIYHKALGEECSKKPAEGRRSVFDGFPQGGPWILVGRLDVNTSGLLLVTDDGDLANHLMHPRYQVSRSYQVRVDNKLTDEQIKACLKGVDLEDYVGRFTMIKASTDKAGRNQWYRVTLKTGRNREVRRVLEAVGVNVSRLIRVAYGSVQLPRNLKPKAYEFLKDSVIHRLQKRDQ